MGRGRAKAKQQKVARKLKYSTGGTDLDRLRSELGPEAYYADRMIELVRAVKLIPELIQRMDKYYPPFGAAPPPPPLPEITVIERRHWWSYAAVGTLAAVVGAAAVSLLA